MGPEERWAERMEWEEERRRTLDNEDAPQGIDWLDYRNPSVLNDLIHEENNK